MLKKKEVRVQRWQCEIMSFCEGKELPLKLLKLWLGVLVNESAEGDSQKNHQPGASVTDPKLGPSPGSL